MNEIRILILLTEGWKLKEIESQNKQIVIASAPRTGAEEGQSNLQSDKDVCPFKHKGKFDVKHVNFYEPKSLPPPLESCFYSYF